MTIPKSAKKGKATITATADTGVQLTVTVNVSAAAVKLTDAAVKAPASLKVGKTSKLTVKLTPAKATGVNVTFKSNNAKGLYVDKAGKLTALKAGAYVIIIKAGSLSVKKTITVK